MKHLVRIVTFVGYPDDWISNSPLGVLSGGTRTIVLPDKVRVWTVRSVAYDDNMTPLYAEPYSFERRFRSLQELIKQQRISPLIQDCPVLDLDNSLRIYESKE